MKGLSPTALSPSRGEGLPAAKEPTFTLILSPTKEERIYQLNHSVKLMRMGVAIPIKVVIAKK
jgi:hypothetical protein